MEVCSLLLSHGADPTIPNCHSKIALDLATSDQNRERLDSKYNDYTKHYVHLHNVHVHVAANVSVPLSLCSAVAVEFKGYQLLNASERGDLSRAKKLLTGTPSLTSFQHMLTMDSALVSPLSLSLPLPPLSLSLSPPPSPSLPPSFAVSPPSISQPCHFVYTLAVSTPPLQHCATASKRKSLVELLIKRGADVNVRNKL